MSLKDLIRRRPAPTTSSAALRAALPEMEAARDLAIARVADYESRSGDITLDGDAGVIEAHWVALREARDEVERVTVAVNALRQRVVAAEHAEGQARLDQIATEAEAISTEVLRGFPGLLTAMEGAIKAIEAHDTLMERFARANQALHDGGRDQVAEPHRLFWTTPDNGSLPYLRKFGPDTILAGPRGPCATFEAWRLDVARAKGLTD